MKKYFETLKEVELFKDLSDIDIENILSGLTPQLKEYKKGDIIFNSGDIVQEVGIVLYGKVYILKEDYLGNRNILAEINKGGIFAEAFSCAKIKKIPVSVMASMETKILFIDYIKILKTNTYGCMLHTKIIENMMFILAKKNIMMNQKIEHISKRTTKEKLLSYLYSQAQIFGGKSFEISLNRQELADFLCVERSAMSNELSKLREDGIIKFNKNTFEIL